jgi:hypothetical protein
MEELDSHWKDIDEIWYMSIVRKSVEKIKFLLQYDQNNGHWTWIPTYIYNNIVLNSLVMRKGSETKIMEKMVKQFYLHCFENSDFMI